MKSKLFKIVLKIFIIIAIIFTSVSTLYAQQKVTNEILFYVKSKTVDVPLSYSGEFEINTNSIKSQRLLITLKKYKIKNIKRAYVNFNLEDTLRFTKEGKPIKMLNLARLYKLKIPKGIIVDSLIKSLSRVPEVIYAEKNGGWKLYSINDPYYHKQWYLKNTGQSGGYVGADIKAEDAWQIFKGSSNIKIGIIDSGVKTNHEDLSGKTTGDNPDYNWHDPDWYYSYAHGTHVAGIAAAKTNNNKGIKGVDWNAQIYSRRIFDSQDHQDDDVFIYNAIVDAVDHGCNVLNNSWGGPDYSVTIRSAFAYAYKMNRVAVAAMDDHGATGPTYPADYGQGIIAVGATTDKDQHAGYSQIAPWIDVSAPGGSGQGDPHDIFSTVAYYKSAYNGYYDYLAGTSMAAPIVTGIASLLKGYKSYLDNDDIENIIKISADDKGAPGWDQYYGTGRVNARKALDLLRSPYILSHKSANGGSVYSSTGSFGITFYGVSGLADGYYIVKRYEVRKSVSFGYTTDTHVWGRGVGTNGFSKASPNYGMGYCDVVSYNNSSATLRTYVYQVWNVAGEYLGYYPTTPSNVHFEYTVLGKNEPLSVYITGPSYLNGGQTGTWTAHPSGGRTPYHYHWEYYVFCDGIENFGDINPDNVPCGYWFDFGGDSPTASRSDWRSFKVKVTVTDANNSTAVAYKTVTVGEGNMQERNNFEKTGVAEEIPTATRLMNNYPNPFNPTTVIKYQLKEPAHVILRVYDVLGKEVAELVNERKSAGYYSVNFDGSKLPSGLYIYRLQANNYVESKKMLLTK